MSDTGSAANSPAKAAAPGSLASRIAAFESGAAANASKQSQSKAIPHADLSNLRSRFDKEGEKPLSVRGSFGLGAAPVSGGSGNLSPKDRAVSLGSGRAVSPMQSPTVILPTPTIARSASSSVRASSSRPMSLRSESANSATSSGGVTATSTGSSLLPGPLAALMTTSSPAASTTSGDDVSVSGLRTPMSSISLSSMQVETGSNAGDYSASSAVSGEETANEEGIATPLEEKAENGLKEGDSMEIALSAVAMKKSAGESGAMDPTNMEGEESSGTDSKKPPQEAVERAAKELEEYTKEESSTAAISQSNDDLPEVAIQDDTISATMETDTDKATSPSLATSPKQKKASTSSRPTSSSGLNLTSSSSSKDRLRRSSTTNSINSVLSHPESDLADANLESYDNEASAAGEKVAESIAPLPHSATGEKESDAPIQPVTPRPVAEVTSAQDADKSAREDDISQPSRLNEEASPVDVPTGNDDAEGEDDLDEDGMPKVKCSDCGNKVSLMKLGEHVCGPSAITTTTKDTGSMTSPVRRDPLDVPTDDVSHSPFSSPAPQMAALPDTDGTRLERPDVPDDAMSVGSIEPDSAIDNLTSTIPDVPTSVPQTSSLSNAGPSSVEEIVEEEDYMTALTSRRDSIDQPQQRPEQLPSSHHEDEDETEELALGMSDAPAQTPTTKFQSGFPGPDSPTPDKEHLSPTMDTPRSSKIASSTSSASAASQNLGELGAGVRRRSTGGAGKKNKDLGDTDSEGDAEPGTATIIR